ncbi:MAG: hypothetical protein K6F55_06685, partial [Eubacterium sp.]|nr:hypothetical protein [Eubacterium sp.]
MKKMSKSLMLVLLLTLCIVLGRGLDSEAANPVEVNSWLQFKTAINSVESIKLTGDIKAEESILITKNTTIDLNGHTYDATKKGDAFSIKSCKLTINDSSNGDGVFMVNSDGSGTSGITVGYFSIEEEGMPEYTGELTINGGTFIGNQGHQYNSIICVRNGSQCNVNGGVFKDSYCAFEMDYLAGECFLSLSGNVLITNNKVGIDALNLTTRRSPVTLSDKAQVNITQNEENVRYPYGVQMPGYEYLFDVKGDISKCSIGMSVGKAYNNLKITNNYLKYNSNTPASKVFFIDNNTDQVIIQNSGEVYVGLADNASATVTTWNELSEAISTADDYASKRIKLGSNITAEDGDGPITITKDQTITIDFNGHYLDRGLYESAPVNNGSVFENKGTLALINNEAGTLSYITGANTTGGCGAIKNAGGVLNVNNVGFLYNKAGLSGGAIQNSDGIVTIDSSHIRGNTANYAGNGIYNDGILRIKGVIDGTLPDIGGSCDTICLVSDDPIEVMGSLKDSRIDITLYNPDREVESYLITNGYGLYNTGSASEIFDVSDEKVSDYFKLGLNDDREVILQNKDVKDIRIHYIANNGSEEVV